MNSILNDILGTLSAFLTGIVTDRQLLVQNKVSGEKPALYYLDFLNDVLSHTEMSVKTY